MYLICYVNSQNHMIKGPLRYATTLTSLMTMGIVTVEI